MRIARVPIANCNHERVRLGAFGVWVTLALRKERWRPQATHAAQQWFSREVFFELIREATAVKTRARRSAQTSLTAEASEHCV